MILFETRRKFLKAATVLIGSVLGPWFAFRRKADLGTPVVTELCLAPGNERLARAINNLGPDLGVQWLCRDFTDMDSLVATEFRNRFQRHSRLLEFSKSRRGDTIVYRSTWKTEKDFIAFSRAPHVRRAMRDFKKLGFKVSLKVVDRAFDAIG